MTDTVRSLPAWVTWQIRPFPDANLLLLHGREPVLIDSGFVGHAEETLAWSHAYAGHVALVVNTHWHSDHVGGVPAFSNAVNDAFSFLGSTHIQMPHDYWRNWKAAKNLGVFA